jgi:hypothetical protein
LEHGADVLSPRLKIIYYENANSGMAGISVQDSSSPGGKRLLTLSISMRLPLLEHFCRQN